MTDKQKAFAAEVAIDDTNIAEAARKAGVNNRQTAHNLLNNPVIQEQISDNRALLARKSAISKDEVEEALTAIVYLDIRKYIKLDPLTGETLLDWENLSPIEAAFIQELSITESGGVSKVKTSRIKIPDKLSALLALAKIKGLMKDQVEISGNISLEKLIESSFHELPSHTSPSLPVLEADYTEVPVEDNES